MVNLNENAIREAAYYNWQNAGCPQGQDEYFWQMAVNQLSGCSCNCSCKSASSKKTSSSAAKKSTKSSSSSAKKSSR